MKFAKIICSDPIDSLSFINHQTRNRRDNDKYLTLIDTIALLHQYQRPIRKISINGKTEKYIEVMPEDIELANELAVHVFKNTLDVLPPQTRRLLTLIQEFAEQESEALNIPLTDFRFTRRQIREFTHWGNTQVHIHCQRLEQMEYLKVFHSTSLKGKSYSLALESERSHTEQLKEVFTNHTYNQ